MSDSIAPIVVVGAGPAGMMLAYQLASNGVPVHVLERHDDFERDFRGEIVQPSAFAFLDQLGILELLRRAGQCLPLRGIRMFFRHHPFVSNVAPQGGHIAEAIHQASFLSLLHEQCSRFPHYRLDFNAPVAALTKKNGKVSGVVVRRRGAADRGADRGADNHIDARLVIVCAGRGSSLRKAAGLEADQLEPSYKTFWLRFDLTGHTELSSDILDGYIRRRSFFVLYSTYANRVQLMWRRARGYPIDWKAPVAELKAELLDDAPEEWHPIIRLAMNEDTERQVLQVLCDRLRCWWSPGVLFLGDAAHAMSPIGAQGLAMAIRDAVVAANHLVRTHRDGQHLGDAVCAAIEAERRPEVEQMQAFQVRTGRIYDAPPLVQFVLAKIVIPLAAKIQGTHYSQYVMNGFTDVRMEWPVPVVAQLHHPTASADTSR